MEMKKKGNECRGLALINRRGCTARRSSCRRPTIHARIHTMFELVRKERREEDEEKERESEEGKERETEIQGEERDGREDEDTVRKGYRGRFSSS